MNLDILNISKYKNIDIINFPLSYHVNQEASGVPIEVIIYYINDLNDVEAFYQSATTRELSLDNRVIFVYQKGRKDGVNRDTIFEPFRNGTYKNFKMRKPMLCALTNELSAFVQSYEGKTK